MKGTEPIVHSLINKIEKQTKLQGRNISFDRFDTSISLAEWLLEKKITSIGTLQHNRKGIPPELKVTKGKEELSSKIYWEKSEWKMSISSYIVSTSKGMKSVTLLSTHPPNNQNDDKKEASII